MSVIGPSCAPPSDQSAGCGCAPKNKTERGLAGAAAASALAAAACTACCVLPFTLPPALLAVGGGAIAILDHAHGWVTKFAITAVAGAWIWIAWRRRRTGWRIARSTLALMMLATVLTASAASWPLVESFAFHALGIMKKKAALAHE